MRLARLHLDHLVALPADIRNLAGVGYHVFDEVLLL